jgi:hypothetical protein
MDTSRKLRKTLLTVASVLAEIPTQYLPNISFHSATAMTTYLVTNVTICTSVCKYRQVLIYCSKSLKCNVNFTIRSATVS